MHSQNVLPSDSSVGLKHGREERDKSLEIMQSLSVNRRRECILNAAQMT